MKRKILPLGSLILGLVGLGYAFSSYVSATKFAVRAAMEIKEKEKKAEEDIRVEEIAYPSCVEQRSACYRQTFDHPPQADSETYFRVDDHLPLEFANTWETAHYYLKTGRDRRHFSKMIGTFDGIQQCYGESITCSDKIESRIKKIEDRAYNEQRAIARVSLCPNAGLMTQLAVDASGLDDIVLTYCP